VSARAQVQGLDFSSADVEIDACHNDNDMRLNLQASAGRDFCVRTVRATKGMDVNGAHVTVSPRMDLEKNERDVEINYNKDKTNLRLMASADNQAFTISQQIDANNRVAPTVNSNGDISVEWERRLSDDSCLTANLRPNDSLDVEWRDNAWTANVNMPIDGKNINGANVSIKRDVSF
jgi:hypothetical protein